MLLSVVPEMERDHSLTTVVLEPPTPLAETANLPPEGHVQAPVISPQEKRGESACPFADRCPWKLGAICDTTPPPVQQVSATHGLRCHIPLDDLRGRETLTQTRPRLEGQEL
jgi:peptide/nickel transport system ATP-binding protein